MAGTKGRSGRRRTTGRLYRLNVRYRPERHSSELGELLELITRAGPQAGADMLDRLAAGLPLDQFKMAPEEVETEALLEGLFGGQ